VSFVELRPSGESHTTTWRQNYRYEEDEEKEEWRERREARGESEE